VQHCLSTSDAKRENNERDAIVREFWRILMNKQKVIAAVRNLADLAEAKSFLEQHGDNALFLGLSPECWITAQRQMGKSVRCRSIWEYASSEGLKMILEQTWYHLAEATKGSKGRIVPHIFSDLSAFAYELLANDLAARSVLKEEQPAEVIVWSPLKPHPIVFQPYHRADLDTTASFCLAFACEQAGIPVRLIPSKVTPPPMPKSVGSKHDVRSFLRYCAVRVRGVLRLLNLMLRRKPYVLVQGFGSDLLNLLPHINDIEKSIPTLCLGGLLPGLWANVTLPVPCGINSHLDLELIALPFRCRDIRRSMEEEIDDALAELGKRFNIPESHPIVESQRKYFKEELLAIAIVQYRRLWCLMRWTKPVGFLTAYAAHWFSHFFLSFAPENAVRLSIQHGGFGYVPHPLIYTNSDAVAIWGNIQKDLIESSGFKGTFVRDHPLAEAHSQIRERVGQPPSQPVSILLATSRQSNFGAPIIMPERDYFGILQKLIEWCERQEGYVMRIRCHPRFDYHSAYEQMLAGAKKVELVPEEESMNESLDRCSIVAHIGSFSTFLIHAAVRGTPILVILPASAFQVIDNVIAKYIPRAATVEEAIGVFESFRSGDKKQWEEIGRKTLAFGTQYTRLSGSVPSLAEYLRQRIVR
jgi:hypothetical protein